MKKADSNQKIGTIVVPCFNVILSGKFISGSSLMIQVLLMDQC